MPQPIIVFDLDGTLVDSAPDLTSALNHVMTHEGLPSFSLAEVRSLVGKGARVLIERGLRHHGRDPAQIPIQTLIELFLDYYGAHLADATLPYPGLETALEELMSQGYGLAVCTNKVEGLSRDLLQLLRLDRFFPVVLGGDTLPVKKPDPLHLTETIRCAGGDPSRAIMVGDSTSDIGAAKAAGVPVIAVSFGYNDVPIAELGADRIIDRYDQLNAAISDLLNAAKS